MNDLALLHYLDIPPVERSSFAWNNLGVEYEKFKLSGKSIGAYRRAESLQNTLAMSNIAYGYIDAGFLPEAEEICKKAMSFDDYDNRVNEAISRAKNVPDEEARKEDEVLERARPISHFFANYGHALLYPNCQIDGSTWDGPLCRLNIAIEEEHFTASGEYEKEFERNTLAKAFANVTGVQQPKKRYAVSYEGRVIGRAVIGTLHIQEQNGTSGPTSLLGKYTKDSDVLLIISASTEEIVVYERQAETGKQIYKLRRLVEG